MKTPQARQRIRTQVATTETPKTESSFNFLESARSAPDNRALATVNFTEAFQLMAQQRADEFRAEIFQQAEQIAKLFVETHLAELEEGLKL